MKRFRYILGGVLFAASMAFAGQAFAAGPDCGMNTGKKATGKPIPIGAVTGVDDGVRLSLTKDEVADLPPVELDRAD